MSLFLCIRRLIDIEGCEIVSLGLGYENSSAIGQSAKETRQLKGVEIWYLETSSPYWGLVSTVIDIRGTPEVAEAEKLLAAVSFHWRGNAEVCCQGSL